MSGHAQRNLELLKQAERDPEVDGPSPTSKREHSADAIRGVSDDLRDGAASAADIRDELQSVVVGQAQPVLDDCVAFLQQGADADRIADVLDTMADALDAGAETQCAIRECIVCADAGGKI